MMWREPAVMRSGSGGLLMRMPMLLILLGAGFVVLLACPDLAEAQIQSIEGEGPPPDQTLQGDSPPLPDLRDAPPAWLGFGLIAVMFIAMVLLNLMPSKRSHQD